MPEEVKITISQEGAEGTVAALESVADAQKKVADAPAAKGAIFDPANEQLIAATGAALKETDDKARALSEGLWLMRIGSRLGGAAMSEFAYTMRLAASVTQTLGSSITAAGTAIKGMLTALMNPVLIAAAAIFMGIAYAIDYFAEKSKAAAAAVKEQAKAEEELKQKIKERQEQAAERGEVTRREVTREMVRRGRPEDIEPILAAAGEAGRIYGLTLGEALKELMLPGAPLTGVGAAGAFLARQRFPGIEQAPAQAQARLLQRRAEGIDIQRELDNLRRSEELARLQQGEADKTAMETAESSRRGRALRAKEIEYEAIKASAKATLDKYEEERKFDPRRWGWSGTGVDVDMEREVKLRYTGAAAALTIITNNINALYAGGPGVGLPGQPPPAAREFVGPPEP